MIRKITINKSAYDALLRDQQFLNCLEGAGVDNWQGYDEAINLFHNATPPNKDSIALPDDYPVFYEYNYIINGEVISSLVHGTVRDLKEDFASRGLQAEEVYKYLPCNYDLLIKE